MEQLAETFADSPPSSQSYTYDITRTLQKNFTRAQESPGDSNHDPEEPRWNDKFVWNHKLLVPMLQHLKYDSPWVLPMIYGSIEQASESHDPVH